MSVIDAKIIRTLELRIASGEKSSITCKSVTDDLTDDYWMLQRRPTRRLRAQCVT